MAPLGALRGKDRTWAKSESLFSLQISNRSQGASSASHETAGPEALSAGNGWAMKTMSLLTSIQRYGGIGMEASLQHLGSGSCLLAISLVFYSFIQRSSL
jgi:hypothetical protein